MCGRKQWKQVLRGLLVTTVCLLSAAAGAARAAELDAAFIDMTVPAELAASAVFPAAITMRNTGTTPWEAEALRLRMIAPKGGMTWGADYILIAQGTTVAPGQAYTFQSYLRAPAASGLHDFQWQVCKQGAHWFGQTTPARRIRVTPRADTAVAAPRPGIPGRRRVLTFEDVQYVGSFKAPRAVGEARGAYSESGLALRSAPDGRDRLFMNYTHPQQVLFEVEIPPLVMVKDGAHSALHTAEVKKIWGRVRIEGVADETLSPNGGFTWIPDKQTLFWTWYHGYKAGDAPPFLGAVRLAEDGMVTTYGPWRVSAPAGLYKSYWGGVLVLPEAFAQRYTHGRTLALGFGGYYSICGSASRGPALGAIAEPTTGTTHVAVTALLFHPHDQPAVRDGDYFNANCGFWSEQPSDPDHGVWTYDDRCRAGVFLDTPAGHAYVAFVRLGTGRLGYDFGAITSAGASEYWYLYDPDDLGEAAAGRREPWRTVPTTRVRVDYPLGRTVTGACFDPRSRRLYLCVTWAYPDGLESHPAVHVYEVQ